MKKDVIKRSFKFNNIELDDPSPNMTIEEVKRHYSAVYPEITTAEIEGPKFKGNKHEYTFKTSVGTKG